MLVEFLTISGVVFWCAAALVSGLIALLLSKEDETLAVILAGAALTVVVLFTDARPSAWALLLAPLYLAVGCAWALYKWRAFVIEALQNARVEFNSKPRYENDGKTPETFPAWSDRNGKRPTAARNKDRITGWIGLWPWSMSWVVLRFPWRVVVRLWDYISATFERMSARIWQG